MKQPTAGLACVEVALVAPSGPLAQGRVRLIAERDNKATTLRIDPRTGRFWGLLPRGRYRVRATAPGYRVPEVTTEFDERIERLKVAAVPDGDGWTFLRRGGVVFPVRIDPTRLEVVATGGLDNDTYVRVATVLAQAVGAKPENQGDPDTPLPGQPDMAERPGFGFRLPPDAAPDAFDIARKTLLAAQLDPDTVRLSTPVVVAGTVAAIGDHFTVRTLEPVDDPAGETRRLFGARAVLSGFNKAFPDILLVRFVIGTPADHLGVIEGLRQKRRVTDVEAILSAVVTEDAVPADYNPASQPNFERIGAPAAWAITLGAGATVAVFDRGIDATHPEIGPGVTQVAVDNDSRWVGASVQHGLATYGLVGAQREVGGSVGFVGLAPDANVIVVRRYYIFTDDVAADTLAWLRGLPQWTTAAGAVRAVQLAPLGTPGNRVDVVSISHGVGLPTGLLLDRALQTVCADAPGERGLVVVCSAGNTLTQLRLLASPGPGTDQVYAGHPSTITVSASAMANGSEGSWAPTTTVGTNWGAAIDLCAEGAGVLSLDQGSAYQSFNGTSFAAPQVAGAAALLIAAAPALSGAGVLALLVDNAERIDATSPTWSGATPATHPFYGRGRLHIGKAMTAARPNG